MKPSQLSSRLRLIASKIDKSSQPNRSAVASDLKKVLHDLSASSTRLSVQEDGGDGMAKSFYVDWEGRGYTPSHMNQDIAFMKEELGEGPIYVGGSESFQGHFFSSAPGLGVAPKELRLPGRVQKLRGGQLSDGSAFEATDIQWKEYQNWDSLVNDLQLFS